MNGQNTLSLLIVMAAVLWLLRRAYQSIRAARGDEPMNACGNCTRKTKPSNETALIPVGQIKTRNSSQVAKTSDHHPG